MSHSRVSPSSAGVWVHCTGMIEMCKDLSDNKSDSAVEGDAGHWLAAELINNPALSTNMVGTTAPNGHLVDKEMFDYIYPYVQDVHRTAVGNLNALHVEEPMPIDRVHKEAFGTPDCWYFDSDKGVLTVWDLKYGWGLVEVYENWQLMMYAIGALDEITGGNGAYDQEIKVKIRLVQPRPYHEDGTIRERTMMGSDLRNYANILHDAAHKALSDEGMLRTGNHCRYCLALHDCPAARQASMNAIDVADIPTGHDVINYDYELDVLERAKEIINHRYDALEEHVKGLIQSGTPVAGRSLKPTPGRKKWTLPVEEIISLGAIYQVDLKKPVAVITPSQAIKAGIPSEMIDGYSQRVSSGMKLVKDDQRKVKELLS